MGLIHQTVVELFVRTGFVIPARHLRSSTPTPRRIPLKNDRKIHLVDRLAGVEYWLDPSDRYRGDYREVFRRSKRFRQDNAFFRGGRILLVVSESFTSPAGGPSCRQWVLLVASESFSSSACPSRRYPRSFLSPAGPSCRQ